MQMNRIEKAIVAVCCILSLGCSSTQAQQRHAGCDTFGTTGIPYAGNPSEDCVDHDDHFRSMKTTDWEALRKNMYDVEAKHAAAHLAALEYLANLHALRLKIDARIQ
jgi:hypothetical protein